MDHNQWMRIALRAEEKAELEALVRSGRYSSSEEYITLATRKQLYADKYLTADQAKPAVAATATVPKRITFRKRRSSAFDL